MVDDLILLVVSNDKDQAANLQSTEQTFAQSLLILQTSTHSSFARNPTAARPMIMVGMPTVPRRTASHQIAKTSKSRIRSLAAIYLRSEIFPEIFFNYNVLLYIYKYVGVN